MTQYTKTTSPDMLYLSSRPALPVLAEAAVAFAVLITKWTVRQRTRRALAALSQEQLDDVGLSRAEAHYQATLPFWRP
ncbi:DUF1127 domain-containing protein [Phaeobacter italicus]|uniref:DUF1127 domain-containing protein n=1 Tax=Phaeobacter italicus TaxID=481446 RepID=UPI00055E7241|nr:DUF1127 domain-containing protein [Phaeobacter italicus]MEE2818632.1 DUF1127 domain-containing protein [Pseudomonadota bacterium]NKX42142.1 DUF1127 domain-containing protein [Rhodobacteraceae bacterium R_SAG2]MBO9440780.1 DUF1127 domain-containing protein [Phaeobacter italicus]MCA0856320.1 DUF1127 domain-containing protein [Phaeobacter italicus]MCI5101738.1 DUF1127 domain-containing protein [Phaeobacter italicus]